MSKSPVEVWLWLLLVMQPYNVKTSYILSQCGGDAVKASRMIRDGECPFLNDKERARAEQVRMGAVREVVETCRKNDIRIITIDDEDYPRLLRSIKNPPVVLFVCGDIGALNRAAALTVVGTRAVSDYGLEAAERICMPLAKMGTVIVSGMAVGADSAAHRACLEAGGITAGVLGCGMLVNYPAENAGLKRETVANGGVLISELLPHTKTFGGYFPQRNRILSGLSLGTLVIEAAEKSGSLLTANHALEQGREIFCIPPHNIFSPRYSGVIPLLRDGAIPVFDYTDIVGRFLPYYTNAEEIERLLDEIKAQPQEYKKPRSSDRHKSAPAEEAAAETAKTADKSAAAKAELAPDEAEVFKLITESPADIDGLMERSGIDFSALAEIMTNLELCGIVRREADGVFSAV